MNATEITEKEIHDHLHTPYKCSHCGELITMHTVFVHHQSFFDKLFGRYQIAGFWCPECGDPWTRCERIPPKIVINHNP